MWWGALAGLAIGGLDLGIAARRVPAIAALPQVPQLADHVAFGAVAGWMLRSPAVRDGWVDPWMVSRAPPLTGAPTAAPAGTAR